MSTATHANRTEVTRMAGDGDSFYRYYQMGAYDFTAPRYRPPHAARL